QSGRLQLAQWLTAPDHPHTARVMVNRVWMHLFGRGIVHTPNDFGVYGERPSHPLLLDHLAARFMEEDWSIKQLIRSIVLSRTYQLSSDASETSIQTDPENQWLARHSRRRLDAESLRDSILRVTGELDPSPAEGSVIRHRDILVNLAGSLHQPSNHRSVYLCYLRSSPPPELAAFDLPDFLKTTAKRQSSVAPGHALYLFNNPFMVEQASLFSEKLLSGNCTDQAERIQEAYNETLNRDPDPEELTIAMKLVQTTYTIVGSEQQAWASLCQALLASNEFRYVD
ncbi:DUF1553 domain-containing protein, partial [Verrucomicrobia bacterium]|nr:DUF1553 domain-containing protein [Verrucomicrobiota bacterium]